nr:hypothetical protein [Tanacetum cinerariifolium]
MFPPPAQVYSPPKKDISWTGLPEFADDTITDYSRPTHSIESNSSDLQNSNPSVSEQEESSNSIMSKPIIKFVKVADRPTVIKTNKVETARKSLVKYAEITPIAVNRTNMNVAQPKMRSFVKSAHLNVRKPFQRKSAVRSQTRVPRVSTTDLGNKGKAIKASACWIWRPKQNTTKKGPNYNSGISQNNIDDKGYWDSGCSRHMNGNISYLSECEPYDGGYSEHNTDFHPMVDFIEASPLRTVTESSLRRNLKLEDEEGINEPAYPLRDVSQREACHTDSSFIVDQDRATIDKSSTLPHDLAPWVTSLVADEGKKEWLPQDLEMMPQSMGRSMDEGGAATERISDDSEEMATIFTSMDATTVLASRVIDVPTGSRSIPTASTPAEVSVPTSSKEVPTAGPVFATATVVTPYSRRKGKEVMVESDTPKKQKVQEQIDAQTSKEVPEEAKSPEEVTEEMVKEMMQLVPIEEVSIESLKVKHPIIDWKGRLELTMETGKGHSQQQTTY